MCYGIYLFYTEKNVAKRTETEQKENIPFIVFPNLQRKIGNSHSNRNIIFFQFIKKIV